MKPETRRNWLEVRAHGWHLRSGRWVSGMTLFLALSGLSIFVLPFSVLNQHMVLVHTLAGVIYLAPLSWYLACHVRRYWDYPLTSIKFTGWIAGVMTLVCSVSGVVLTLQALFGTRIDYYWRNVHVLTTFGVLLFLGAHLLTLWLRDRVPGEDELARRVKLAARAHARSALLATSVLLAATLALSAAVRPTRFENRFPDDYDLPPGDAGPFAPSLARTKTGGAYDARSLAGSAACGTSGCHEQIYQEWLPSAHRYASLDAGFQAIQSVMAEQNGPASTRYCGGCHDPISLFSGTKNIGVENLSALDGYQEGLSCLVCHGIEETDVKGNANYVVHQPERYVWELRQGGAAKLVSDFLIRAYPEQHVATLSRTMFKTPEFCAACHKQFIDEEVNKVGWVQLQNQYDNWKASRWHAQDPQKTIECRECHMPLVDSHDPARGDAADFNRSADDGKHRSHRFLGANQFIPTLAGLEGAEEHVALTERWLRGEIEVPEIAERWRSGPVVPLELELPAEAVPGAPLELRVHAINNKAGHDFPTGPLDIIQAWIEVQVHDAEGALLFHSGGMNERGMIDTGSFLFKAEPVDRYGNLIDRHNLWEMVGVRFKRSLFPGSEEVASYSFDCPGAATDTGGGLEPERVALQVPEGAQGELSVRARLNYRKFDQYLLDYAFGPDSGLSSPVTVLSEAEGRIRIAAVPAQPKAATGGSQ
jgi:hypothetical protein